MLMAVYKFNTKPSQARGRHFKSEKSTKRTHTRKLPTSKGLLRTNNLRELLQEAKSKKGRASISNFSVLGEKKHWVKTQSPASTKITTEVETFISPHHHHKTDIKHLCKYLDIVKLAEYHQTESVEYLNITKINRRKNNKSTES